MTQFSEKCVTDALINGLMTLIHIGPCHKRVVQKYKTRDIIMKSDCKIKNITNAYKKRSDWNISFHELKPFCVGMIKN